MSERENLLAFIEQMKAEDEQAKIYGDDWLHRDYL